MLLELQTYRKQGGYINPFDVVIINTDHIISIAHEENDKAFHYLRITDGGFYINEATLSRIKYELGFTAL